MLTKNVFNMTDNNSNSSNNQGSNANSNTTTQSQGSSQITANRPTGQIVQNSLNTPTRPTIPTTGIIVKDGV